MRIFVTGGTGFIGRRVVDRLRGRGDEVVALVRSAARAEVLSASGCELVEGDLGSADAIARGASGAEAVIHLAAGYRVGIPARECAELHEINVRGTERVLDAAIDAGVPRIVYVSTANVFGNTHGRPVDESHERDPAAGFLSCYDETKFLAHTAAKARIAEGAPVIIVQPGAVYGSDDPSQIGNVIDQTRSGKMKLLMFPEFELNYVHVDDLADGIVAALDRGRIGEAYALGGEIATMRQLVTTVAELSGGTPPKRALPAALMKAGIPFGPVVGKLLGFPPNLRELIRTSDGVSIVFTDEKARRELGHRSRPLREGLADTLA
jgi:dihydroflavonol-4-reductase